jgi:hypothetical protein
MFDGGALLPLGAFTPNPDARRMDMPSRQISPGFV